jgi:hypothetical protein
MLIYFRLLVFVPYFQILECVVINILVIAYIVLKRRHILKIIREKFKYLTTRAVKQWSGVVRGILLLTILSVKFISFFHFPKCFIQLL